MSKRSGKTQAGEDSFRSLDNACKEENRRWLVVETDFRKFNRDGSESVWKPLVEKWESKGITVKDAATNVIAHLTKACAMVVDSGGKSLHAWFNVLDDDEDLKAAFKKDAVKIGADSATFRLHQWCRFPGGARRRDDGTRVSQEILFFNPERCP
jgi:hypothetical protein